MPRMSPRGHRPHPGFRLTLRTPTAWLRRRKGGGSNHARGVYWLPGDEGGGARPSRDVKTPRSGRRSPRKTRASGVGSSPAALLLSFGGAADKSQGHTDEVGVPSGGGRAGGGGVSFWPYAPRALRPRRRLDQQTPRASDDRVWRSPGHWACARVVGSAAAHPGACAVGLCTRALGILGPRAPLFFNPN